MNFGQPRAWFCSHEHGFARDLDASCTGTTSRGAWPLNRSKFHFRPARAGANRSGAEYTPVLRATMSRATQVAPGRLFPRTLAPLARTSTGGARPHGAGTSGFGDKHGLRSEACNSEVMRVLEDVSVWVLCGMAAVVGKESYVS